MSHRVEGSNLGVLEIKVQAPSTPSCGHDEKCSLQALCSILCTEIYKERQKTPNMLVLFSKAMQTMSTDVGWALTISEVRLPHIDCHYRQWQHYFYLHRINQPWVLETVVSCFLTPQLFVYTSRILPPLSWKLAIYMTYVFWEAAPWKQVLWSDHILISCTSHRA